MSDTRFEPVIVGFLCNWCSYRGADLAGTARTHHAYNVRVIRTMCSARVEPTFVLKALREGADGVLILGCHPGDCHYAEGNYKTMRRYALLKRLLRQFGVEDARVQLGWISAGEGEKFAHLVDKVTEEIRELGPLNWQTRVLVGGVLEEPAGAPAQEMALAVEP